MINVLLLMRDHSLCGFEISGHSTENADDFDGKLVCSAVSSAAIMTANTITDVLHDDADVKTEDGYLSIIAKDEDKCGEILDGFRLHISALSDEYPDKIRVKFIAE